MLTVACVPAAARLDGAGWARAEAIVEDFLSERPAAVRRQLLLFLRVLGLLTFLRWGRSLASLEPERARRLLGGLERSPLVLLRRGAWGVRTICFMGYYAQPEIRRGIGYAAVAGGWAGRGMAAGAWSDRDGAAPPEAGVLTASDPGDGDGARTPGGRPHA